MRISTLWYDTFGLQSVPGDTEKLFSRAFGARVPDPRRLKDDAVLEAGRDARVVSWCITPIGLAEGEVMVLARALRNVAVLACEDGIPRGMVDAGVALLIAPQPLQVVDGDGQLGIAQERFTAEFRLGAHAKSLLSEIVRPVSDIDRGPRGFRLNVLGYYTLDVDGAAVDAGN